MTVALMSFVALPARIWRGGPSSNCWSMLGPPKAPQWQLDGGNGLVRYHMSSEFVCTGPNVFDLLQWDYTLQAPPSITVWPFSPTPCNCPDTLAPTPVLFNITAHDAWIHEPGLAPLPAYMRFDAGPFPGEVVGVSKYTAITDSDTIHGSAVFVSSDGHVDLAQANASTTTKLIGLALAPQTAGNPVEVQTEGILTLTAGQWDLVAGTVGGLTPNAYYYLYPLAAGLLTETRPATAGEYIVIAGIALSTTQLELRILDPILL